MFNVIYKCNLLKHNVHDDIKVWDDKEKVNGIYIMLNRALTWQKNSTVEVGQTTKYKANIDSYLLLIIVFFDTILIHILKVPDDKSPPTGAEAVQCVPAVHKDLQC